MKETAGHTSTSQMIEAANKIFSSNDLEQNFSAGRPGVFITIHGVVCEPARLGRDRHAEYLVSKFQMVGGGLPREVEPFTRH